MIAATFVLTSSFCVEAGVSLKAGLSSLSVKTPLAPHLLSVRKIFLHHSLRLGKDCHFKFGFVFDLREEESIALLETGPGLPTPVCLPPLGFFCLQYLPKIHW